MKRRNFLTASATGLAASVIASPAIAQSAPAVRWRMQTAWPRSLDTVQGSTDVFAKRVQSLTDGKFEIRVHAAAEIVPPPQIFDAVQNQTIECGHVLSSFYIGKNMAYAFDAGIPFGLNLRQQHAWLFHGGGLAMLRELFAKAGIMNFAAGNVGVQMGGFYRKEIKTVEDLKGLKFRIGGIGGVVLSKLGVVPTQIATADIYPSLERGTIDAAEWIGPYDDEKLGLHKVAKYYYYPGWWEGSAQITILVNLAKWNELPASYKEAFEMACHEQNVILIAKYDALNPAALKRLIAQGVQLKQFPRPVMDACYKATQEMLEEQTKANPDFKKLYDSWKVFLEESNSWFRVAEAGLDNYRYSAGRRR